MMNHEQETLKTQPFKKTFGKHLRPLKESASIESCLGATRLLAYVPMVLFSPEVQDYEIWKIPLALKYRVTNGDD